MFRLASVHKCYAGKPVLCAVDLEIPRHQRTVLIGPSGSGKSTVLGVMTGLLKPDKGQVYFEGEVVSEVRLPEIRKHLGYVIQDGGPFPHLTALENVTLMARYVGWDSTAIRDRVRELSTLACLPEDVLKRYPAEMSGGQRQRVSLMRALMLDAEVLLLDEPFGALDPIVRTELQNDLVGIFRKLKKTVVLVTHDLAEAVLFADQLVLMRGGRIVQIGTVDDLLERPIEPFVRSIC